jgi:DNA-binding NarL/FixJ family response regulator
MPRILLVEDHLAFRQALALVLDQEPGCSIVAQAGTLAEAQAVTADIDIAIVDLSLPDGDGTEFIAGLRSSAPDVMVLALTASVDPLQIARAVEAGAAGVLHKSVSLQEIIMGVHRLAEGEWLLSPSEVVRLLRYLSSHREQTDAARQALRQLTPRERQVLEALADGLDSKEIAARLGISVETERTHMVNILSKLGLHTRLQALVFLVRHGAVTIT